MQKFLIRVYSSRKLSLSFKLISHAAVIISAAAYILLLHIKIREGYLSFVRFAAFSAAPFVIVTVLRMLIDAPRPYEIYDFYEAKPKGKAGRSFPSRHVLSAFMIATLAFPVSIPLGAALTALAMALSVARVALGIHFVRDAATGALIGVLSGILGILI